MSGLSVKPCVVNIIQGEMRQHINEIDNRHYENVVFYEHICFAL